MAEDKPDEPVSPVSKKSGAEYSLDRETIDDKSPGKMSNKSPQKQPPAKSGKNVTCNVYLLDGENVEITLDKNDVGRALFDQVCTRLDLIEKDYFGLTYIDDRGPTHLKYWLNLEKKISKQKKKGAWVFEFALKFYPPDPTHLRESLTRWLVVLQIRRDLLSGRLPCTFTTYALLGSYNVQADLGEYDPQDHGNSYDYIKDMAFAPNQTPELLEKIADLHKLHKGQTPDEAEKCFLDNAKKLAMYGVDLHKAKDSENQAIMLGVCCSGLLIFRDKLRINRFVWPKILKLSYKRNHFYIKIRPGELERNDTTMMFKLDNHRLAKRLWKTCVEHHAFFRLREAEKPTNNLTFPRFGSKFRYSGRTLYQSTRSAQLLDRPPPFFERSQPARNSMGDPGNRSRSMDELGRKKDPYDDGMYDPNRSWDEKDKRDIKGVPTAFEKARNSGDARRSGDEDTLQRRPYDSDTADRRDRVPSHGDATMEREKAQGLNESMGISPGKAETDKERRKREKEEDKKRKEEKKRQEEEEKKKKKKGGKEGEDRLGLAPGVDDIEGEDKDYPYGKDGYDKEGYPFPYIYDNKGNLFPYPQDGHDKDGYRYPYGTAGYDKDGNPNPFVYDKDGNPNPYACDKEGRPNPYVYGKDGKPCPYGKGGYDQDGNPSPYGKDGKDKDGNPFPYVYDKYGNPYPHGKGPHDKEGNRAAHGDDGLDIDGNPFPFIYDKRGEPYPLGKDAHDRDGKTCPYDQDGKDKHGQRFPYIYDKDGKVLPYWKNKIEKDRPDRDGYRNPFGTAGYDRDGNPNPYVYDKDGNPNPYACDKDGNPNPYVFGKDGKPCPYGKGGFDKDGNPSPYGKDGKDKEGNPFPYVYDKFGNPYRQGKGPHDKEGNRAAHGPDGLDKVGSPFPYIYDKQGEPYPHGKDAYDRDGKNCPYDQDGKDRYGDWFPYMFDKDGNILPYWQDKLDKDRPDSDNYVKPYGTAGYDKDGNPNPYVYDKDGNPNPYVCDKDGNPNPYVYGKDGKPCPYGKGGYDKEGNPSPYGKDGKDKDGNPFPYIYDKYGNPYPHGKGPHDKEGNRAVHGADGLDREGNTFPFIYDKHGQPYPHGKDAYDRDGNRCPYDRDGKDKHGKPFPYIYDKHGNLLPYCKGENDKGSPSPFSSDWRDKNGHPGPYMYDKDGNLLPYWNGTYDSEGYRSPYDKEGKDKDGRPFPYVYDRNGALLPQWRDTKDGGRSPSDGKDKSRSWKAKDDKDKDKGKKGGLFGRLKKGKHDDDDDDEGKWNKDKLKKGEYPDAPDSIRDKQDVSKEKEEDDEKDQKEDKKEKKGEKEKRHSSNFMASLCIGRSPVKKGNLGSATGFPYGVGLGIGKGDMTGVVGEEKSVDKREIFLPIPKPIRETKESLKSGHSDNLMPFFHPAATSTVGRGKVPPPVPPKGNHSLDDSFNPPTVATEKVKYNPHISDVPMSSRNIPLVKTETRTVTYERDNCPSDLDDGMLVSAQSHSSRLQTIETTTYKTEKDGIEQTRVEHRVVMSGDEDDEFDYDSALADAIRSVTEFNPDMSVERIECVQQIEDVKNGN